MFTGIIEETGTLKNLNDGRAEFFCEKILEDMKVGDSISVNGICLTVVEFAENFFAADVMPETFRRTSLEGISVGGVVNLERALKVGDRLGGHFVTGHIDGIGKILNIRKEKNALVIEISAEEKIHRQIVSKGSITLDGISLTVVDISNEKFSVSMIPHTREVTNFKTKRIGSPVNIETDILAKYMQMMLSLEIPSAKNITREFLKLNGF